MELTSTIEYLKFQLEHGRLVLFTGSGFSLGAFDLDGRKLPSGPQFASELWSLCFPGEPRDEDSSLPDLFHTALTRQKGALSKVLARRFAIQSTSLPDAYELWFSLPWRRIYTLNIDDLPEVAGRHFTLPRAVQAVSGISKRSAPETTPPSGALEVVHLNGMACDGPDGVTFSSSQYAERLTSQEPWYARLAADLLAFPVVYVGTPLDENLLWQHIEFRGTRGSRSREFRPKSVLVVPTLGRARQLMLKDFNIEWLSMTGDEFYDSALKALAVTKKAGTKTLTREAAAASGIADVAVLSAQAAPTTPSMFLLGDEPNWHDIKGGRAVVRAVDEDLLESAKEMLDPTSKGGLLLLAGTAGSGKSTSLMNLALRLSAAGTPVAWVSREADISPRDIRAFCRSTDCKPVLVIDDVDRYGSEGAPVVADVIGLPRLTLVICSTRASKAERFVASPRLSGLNIKDVAMPHLADDDITKLIDLLDREHRLGWLKGRSPTEQRRAFKQGAQSQLIVAMIEATSGKKFEEKVVDEWRELTPEGQLIYALLAVTTSLRFTLDREDILVATRPQGNATLTTLDTLVKRGVVVQADDGRMRARHRVIAEKLVAELGKNGNLLETAISGLAFIAAVKATPSMPKNTRERRLLKAVLNHDYLFRALSLDGARTVYNTVEELLTNDYQFWLHRGSLEVEAGDIRSAENFLSQAHGLNPDDPFVMTEYAYMIFKRAVLAPTAPDSPAAVAEATATLKDQIVARGDAEPHPFHILGSQGLSWARRANLTKDEKKQLLRGLLADVDCGVKKHPKRPELSQLRDDLQKEILSLELASNL